MADKRKRISDKVIITSGILILVLTLLIKSVSFYTGLFMGLNTEDCIKGRLFLVKRHYKQMQDGDYFVFKFKGSYLYNKGFLFVKFVGCSPGEKLYTKNTKKGIAYYCNNRMLGYACNRTKYHNCPEHLQYNTVIPKGKYFALGTSWNAYDSRYWGLVDKNKIVGKAYKLF